MSGKEINSPLGLAKEVNDLMNMPQHHCKQRGACCRVATFKGSLNHQQIAAMAKDPSHPGHEQARDFHSIFIPFASQAEVRELANEFVDRVRTQVTEMGGDPDNVSFFHCKYVLPDGRCGVHEDRPVGCRAYPFPHERTIYHPGCGYEQQGIANWNRIKEILSALGMEPDLSPKSTQDDSSVD